MNVEVWRQVRPKKPKNLCHTVKMTSSTSGREETSSKRYKLCLPQYRTKPI